MKRNMGAIDRSVRIILAMLVCVLIYLKILTGVAAVVLAVLALVFVLTSALGFCPLYVPFGIKTCKVIDPKEVAQTQVFEADGDLAPKDPQGQ